MEYIVKSTDIGKGSLTPLKITCNCCGNVQTTFPFQPLGKVQAADVGRLLKLKNGLWYAESNEQFKARTK